jgi:ribose/xylose/arabinose/galactoside ABC-type transport system permease subunit
MKKLRGADFFKNNTQLILLVLLIIAFAIWIPEFATSRNVTSILQQISITSLICCGMSVVLIGGNLDLSVGSAFSFLCVLCVKMQSINPVLSVVLTAGAAVLIGVANGYIIHRFNLNSIIVTLGMMSILSGAAKMLTDSMNVSGEPNTFFSDIADIRLGGLPFYVIIFIILAIFLEWMLRNTLFGKTLYYLGTNAEASKVAGQSVRSTTILSFVICSSCVAVAAFLQSARTMTASPIGGIGLEFTAMTAVLLGGVSLKGGKGSILGTVLGVLLLGVIVNGLNLKLVPFEYQKIAKGALILLAIAFNEKVKYKNEI